MQSMGEFEKYHNHQRCRESPSNLTPADAYFGKGESILEQVRRDKGEGSKTRPFKEEGNNTNLKPFKL